MVRLGLILRLIGCKTGASLLSQSLKRSNRNHVITFDSHLKTALIPILPALFSFAKLETIRCVDSPNTEQVLLDQRLFLLAWPCTPQTLSYQGQIGNPIC